MASIWEKFYFSKEEREAAYKKKFEAIYKNLRVEPLTTEDDFKNFYEPLVKGMMGDFVASLNMNENTGKFLFTGHRGCGVSTELNHLAMDLVKKYTVIQCSLLELADPLDPDFKDILLLVATETLRKLLELGYDLEQLKPAIKVIYSLTDRSPEEFEKHNIELYLNNLYHIMLGNAKRRGEIRLKLESKTVDIIDIITDNANLLEQFTEKQPIVIIDDLDKITVDEAEKIFLKNKRTMNLPQCRIIYTMPFGLYYKDEFSLLTRDYTDCLVIPLTNMYSKKNKENDKGVEIFEKLVKKRIKEPDDYFEDEIVTDIIVRTGGIVKHLIELLNQCCFVNMQEKIKFVGDKTLKNVIDRRKRDWYRLLDKKERSMLRKVYETKNIYSVEPKTLPHLLDFGFVLEQRQDDVWFDIHPILRQALDVAEEPDFADFK
jgi:hypothetical protein